MKQPIQAGRPLQPPNMQEADMFGMTSSLRNLWLWVAVFVVLSFPGLARAQ